MRSERRRPISLDIRDEDLTEPVLGQFLVDETLCLRIDVTMAI
jgi:hypothetical protein